MHIQKTNSKNTRRLKLTSAMKALEGNASGTSLHVGVGTINPNVKTQNAPGVDSQSNIGGTAEYL